MEFSKKAANVIFHLTKEKLAWKKCFKDDSCEEPTIGSHSVQENRFLNRIAEDGHVLYLQQKIEKDKASYKFHKQGIGSATTFPGFCGTHDTNVFIPIERKDYEIGDKEQEFLFAYRAFAFEYQAKKSYYQTIRHYYDLFDNKDIETLKRYHPLIPFDEINMEEVKEKLLERLNANEKPLKNVENIRKFLNEKLDNKCFSEITTHSFVFPEEYKLVVSNVFYLYADNLGKEINGANEDIISTLTVLPQENETIVLFSYPTQFDVKFRDFMKYIDQSDLEERKKIFSMLIAVYTENIALNPKLWDSMEEEQKKMFYIIYEGTVKDKITPFIALDLNLFTEIKS
ncbi:hypothetical protein I0292_26140 (plasmid) [Priestia megaterium]|uniref:hypothetical protein n=1 Tax=Priestia megaterium TaxID=1404 RepID=UPI00207012E5|nr:hypothetical protein [Priestia megaterium]UOO43862.1 hypothetical protein I0292_26140 [Priestia megaterium]